MICWRSTPRERRSRRDQPEGRQKHGRERQEVGHVGRGRDDVGGGAGRGDQVLESRARTSRAPRRWRGRTTSEHGCAPLPPGAIARSGSGRRGTAGAGKRSVPKNSGTSARPEPGGVRVAGQRPSSRATLELRVGPRAQQQADARAHHEQDPADGVARYTGGDQRAGASPSRTRAPQRRGRTATSPGAPVERDVEPPEPASTSTPDAHSTSGTPRHIAGSSTTATRGPAASCPARRRAGPRRELRGRARRAGASRTARASAARRSGGERSAGRPAPRSARGRGGTAPPSPASRARSRSSIPAR